MSDTAEMLAFTARHGIKPIIETFAMSDANRALEHTRAGKARFRAACGLTVSCPVPANSALAQAKVGRKL